MEIIPSLWLTPVKMKVCTAFGDEKGEKHLSAEPQSEGLKNVLGSPAKMPKGALASNLTGHPCDCTEAGGSNSF